MAKAKTVFVRAKTIHIGALDAVNMLSIMPTGRVQSWETLTINLGIK